MTNKHWFIKYKLYHIPFWFAYHIMWWIITVGSVSAVANNIINSAYSIKFLFYVIFQAAGVYFNLYYLIPKFLKKGHYAKYITFLLLTIIVVATFIVSGYYFSAYLSSLSFRELYNQDPANFMEFFSINALPSTVASITLAMSVKLTKNWIDSERRQHILEKEKLETELKFLKSQFNPHFLFNTINSIFVLIHKNPDLASESLATFSALLRYQLYECNENEIELSKELLFLDNFIQLEKLRIDENNTDLNFDIADNETAGKRIAPFLLMPFIENSFKHVSKNRNQANFINLKLKVNAKNLIFQIENSVSNLNTAHSKDFDSSGIGLKNVKRRLDLIYPGNHELTFDKVIGSFKVSLKINFTNTIKPIKILNENKVYHN
jgi:two-component system, LytTR family, sensor kinase